MSLHSLGVQAVLLISILSVCSPSGGSSERRLQRIVMKQDGITSDRNVVPGSTKYVDPGTCLTHQNQDVPLTLALNVSCSLHAAKELEAMPKAQIAVSQSKAKQFLSALHRTKRNVWDRSRPDVQQWIQQFMNMGYDEARLETDLSYWMDQARSNDQGRQHHHDENAPMSQQDPGSYRHGANVNYDYY